MIYFILCAILTPLVWLLLRSPAEPYSPEQWAEGMEGYEDYDIFNPDKYC